jgi:hypothetical protein
MSIKMIQLSVGIEQMLPPVEPRLPPKVRICLPPILREAFEATAAECPHPAWRKLEQRGRHFVIATNELEDIEEVADWARTALVEPPGPLTKAQRQGYQAVVARAAQWAILEPLGPCHIIASGWRQTRLGMGKVVSGGGKLLV